MWAKYSVLAALLSPVLGYPSLEPETIERRYDGFPSNLTQRLGTYVPPSSTDSRGPCPGLNTLANHGLINHNGKNINSNDIVTAFAQGFGIAFDGIATALHNFEVVCEYVNGVTCGVPENNGTFILTNLTLLGEPHAFEHDHSFSRQDFKQAYANGGITDNIYFNSTEFQTSLDVVGFKPSNPPMVKLADYQQFNQIRLQRESIQNTQDFHGWFQQNIPTQLFEVGFIFGAMFDRFTNGTMKGTTPMVRLDWWNFWFSEESFPTQLGWVPASTEVFNSNFITSVSKTVIAQPLTSTPTNLPAGATAKTDPPASNLPEGDPSPTLLLFQSAPYVAPTAPSAIHSSGAAAKVKRAAATSPALSASKAVATAPSVIVTKATSIVSPAPTPFDWYQQKLDVGKIRAQVAAAQSYESAVFSAITSLL